MIGGVTSFPRVVATIAEKLGASNDILYLPNVKTQTFRGLAHKAAQPRLGQSSKLSVVTG